MIPMFVRAFEASAVIAARRIVMFSDTAASARIATANSSTAPAIGVSDTVPAAVGEMCDVHLAGMASVVLGGTVTAGAPLMSDANGAAIVATAAAASTRRVVGFALQPGVAGDIIDVWLSQGLLDRA